MRTVVTLGRVRLTGARILRVPITWLAVGASALFAIAACSSSKSGDGDADDNVNQGGGGSGSDGEGGTPGILFVPDAAVDGGDPFVRNDPPCVDQSARAETVPVDFYIMFDQSGSMISAEGEGTRLDAVRAALANFFNDFKTTGIGVGIGYFGYLPIGETSCDPAEYATPAVSIATLPGSADGLIASLNGIAPTGETPTGAAIRGACQYTNAFKLQNPSHFVFNLLVTDGVPEAPVSSIGPDGGTCNPTLEDAVQATRECAEEAPGVDTYVLGVGPNLENLNQIAAAGNTQSAYLVSGGDVTSQVLEALKAIRGQALIPCEYAIPPAPEDQQLDLTKVNVEFTADDGSKTELYNVPDWTYCGPQGGWFYTNDYTRIALCENTCTVVEASSYGQVDFTMGCEDTRVIR